MAHTDEMKSIEEIRKELPCKNREVTKTITAIVNKVLETDETPYFYVVSDVMLDSRYGECFCLVTNKRLISYDPFRKDGDGLLTFKISDIKKAEVKRMYGNAVFRVRVGEELFELNKCSYSVTENFDSIAHYINELNDGKDEDFLISMVYDEYIKRLLFCPKCGARLPYRNATCIKCADKKQIFGRLFVYCKPFILRLILGVAGLVFMTVINLVPPLLTKQLVDSTLVGLAGLDAVGIDAKLSELLSIVVTLLVLRIVHDFVGMIETNNLRFISESFIKNLKTELYAKSQYLPIKYYDKTSTGSVISRINGDTVTLNNFVMQVTQTAFTKLIELVAIIVVMVSMNPVLAILALLPVPIVVMSSRVFSKYIYPFYHRIWNRGSKINSILADTIPGIKVVKAFTSEKKSINNFEDKNRDHMKEVLKTVKVSSIYNFFNSIMIMSGTLVIWGLGGWMVLTGQTFLGCEVLTVGGLVAFINYMNQFYVPVQFFLSFNEVLMSSLSAAERVFEVLDADDEEDRGKGNIPEDGIKGKIEFKNVSFSYEKGKKILNNVSFTIEPGETVGIVGSTGSGKSTVVNLILRYYDNYEGEVFIDDQNIRDIDLNYYRSNVGYVLQEPLLFKDTVFRNIAHTDHAVPVEDVVYAAQVANAHKFIRKLPDGYDTMLGERGVGLSGGERQRISIARAVLKDPSILILDEATAAVDTETERMIQEAIDRIINGRTTIMIAHRLSTLKKADKIIVVEEGKIAEVGSPEELMAAQGRFYKLVQIQSLGNGGDA